MENCNFDDFYLLSKCLITMNGHSLRWWETCSEHDIAGGMAHLALNNNHSLTPSATKKTDVASFSGLSILDCPFGFL
jgi:hypothetical protein